MLRAAWIAPAKVAAHLERSAKMKITPKRIWRIMAVIFGMAAVVASAIFLVVLYTDRSYFASLAPETREEMLNDKGDPLGLAVVILFIVSLFLIIACVSCLYAGKISTKKQKELAHESHWVQK